MDPRGGDINRVQVSLPIEPSKIEKVFSIFGGMGC
jgi:hypothetical protein